MNNTIRLLQVQSLSLMKQDLSNQQQLLADFMSDVSERCYSAGWILNLEYVLWNAIATGERKYGHDTITKENIEILRNYSNAANSWIIFHSEIEETAISLEEWEKKFQNDIQRHPELLQG
jgi:hypothetical protein